jgi:hypothetical protein
MFGSFSRRKAIDEAAKNVIRQSLMAEPLFSFGEPRSIGANRGSFDESQGPLLLRILFIVYALQNVYRTEIGFNGATEKDYETLVYSVAEEMKTHPMFGRQAVAFWDDLIDLGEAGYGAGIRVAPSKDALARLYGFWLLKNVGSAAASIDSTDSLLVGRKAIENLQRILRIGQS